MEAYFRTGDNSGAPQPTRVDRQKNLNLGDTFEPYVLCSSRGDRHQRMGIHVSRQQLSTASENHLKLRTKGVNAANNDELVKDMSNLPSFLEQGVEPQVKAFNVGVLDWSHLEKWQSSKHVPYRSNDSFSSHSNSSSLSSMEEPSTRSRMSHSSSIDAHHMHQNPIFTTPLKGPSLEACPSDGKSMCNVSKYRIGAIAKSIVKEDMGSTASSCGAAFFCSHDLSPSSKGCRCNDSEKESRWCRRSQSMSFNPKSAEKEEKAVHIRLLDDSCIVCKSKGSASKLETYQKSLEERNRDSSERSRKVHHLELSCDIPRSCTLPCDVNGQTIRVLRPCRSPDAKKIGSASAAGSQVHSSVQRNSQLKESSEDGHPVIMAVLPPLADLPEGSRISKGTTNTAKAKYPLPTGPSSIVIGKTNSKSSFFTGDAKVVQAYAAHTDANPCTTREVLSSSLVKSCCNKFVAVKKARPSPLKRLLDPLLKPKERNNTCSSKLPKNDLKPVGMASKTLERPSTAPCIRAGLNSTVIDKIQQNGRNNDSTVIQASVRVVVQNGCPLFTFAVEGVKDFLCAALSKLSTEKRFGDRYLYTLFSIHGLKNKSWINLRGKGSGHGYNQNVVAQMEFSHTQLLKTADRQSAGNNLYRQFVLSSVHLKPEEQTDSQCQVYDELAAILISIPWKKDGTLQTDKFSGTTVILPSGTHTVPSEGKPSSLIGRWSSGGQCDCGGWDSGCKLRILTDSKCQSSSPVKFNLYDQGGTEVKQPVLNLAPHKDKEGVLAVGFSSSVSPLQAFGICLAMFDTRRQTLRTSNANPHHKNHIREDHQVEVPGSYVSTPPHSPVGRV